MRRFDPWQRRSGQNGTRRLGWRDVAIDEEGGSSVEPKCARGGGLDAHGAESMAVWRTSLALYCGAMKDSRQCMKIAVWRCTLEPYVRRVGKRLGLGDFADVPP